MKDSPNLDLLRSIAVSLVVGSHIALHYRASLPDFNYKTLGRVGVALFFVHTTLVLMMSLQRHGPAMGPFLVRRFFRIYPLSVVAVLTTALMMTAAPKPMTLGELASNLLLVQNISGHKSFPDPLWSLPYEVQMYLVLPVLYLAIQRNALARITAICAASLVVAALAWNGGRTLLIGFIPCFLPGALAFVLRRHITPRLSPWVLPCVAIGGALGLSQLAATGLDEVKLFWGFCLLVGIVILLCREITFAPLAASAQTVARYSYGIYLSHMFVMWFMFAGNRPWYIQLAMFGVAQASVAYLLYRSIEAPGIKLGARLADQLTARGSRLRDLGRSTRPSPVPARPQP